MEAEALLAEIQKKLGAKNESAAATGDFDLFAEASPLGVQLEWNYPNATQFAIFYGSRSGEYPHLLPGKTSPTFLSNLAAGQQYFFQIAALDAAGNEIARSAETATIAAAVTATTGATTETSEEFIHASATPERLSDEGPAEIFLISIFGGTRIQRNFVSPKSFREKIIDFCGKIRLTFYFLIFFVMSFSVKKLPKSEVEITIEVNPKVAESARAEAVKRFQKEVKLDGFRPGTAPIEKVIEKVGERNIAVEATDIAVKLSYVEAVKAEKLPVVSHPKIEIKSDSPLKFVARVAVLPEVKVGDWRKIKLKKEVAKVEPAEIESVVKNILKGNAEAKPITDRAAKKGDRVEIDFAGATPDGVPLDGTQSRNHPLVLGEGNFIPGFEEGVVGMSVGEEKNHPVKFPENYHAKHLAGSEVNFKLKLQKIEELVEPELNDDFAKKVSGGQKNSWSEVEADIAEHLKSRNESQSQQKLESDLVAELLKISTVEVPEILVDEEVEWMLKDLKNRLESGGMEWAKYLESLKKTEEELRKEMRVEGENRVKVRLILDKLVETEKPELDEKEVDAAIPAASRALRRRFSRISPTKAGSRRARTGVRSAVIAGVSPRSAAAARATASRTVSSRSRGTGSGRRGVAKSRKSCTMPSMRALSSTIRAACLRVVSVGVGMTGQALGDHMDGVQGVAHLVGDAGGEGAHGHQLLGAAGLGLACLQFGADARHLAAQIRPDATRPSAGRWPGSR